MKKSIVAAISACVISSASLAAGVGQQQAQSFYKMYTSLCTQRLGTLDEFRKELQNLPQLPPEKAKKFLAGAAGEAWSVPDKNGLFVLSLPTGKKYCAIHARRADTDIARKLFVDLVSNAPKPFAAKKIEDTTKPSEKGVVRTVSYEWVKSGAPVSFVFILSTNSSNTADVQVLGSAAIIKK